jgi:hypothetical protein
VRVLVEVTNDLPAHMKRQVQVGARAVTVGIAGATAQVKAGWRDQITAAGLGPMLAKTIRSAVYPKGQTSPNAAGLIWSKAPKLISAHNTGPLIRSKDGFWMAIPLPVAGKGKGGSRITPGEWEQRTGRRLRFVYRSGKSALLVADDARLNKKSIAAAKGGKRRKDGILTGAQTIPIFALVPQVKLRKRLNLETVAHQAGQGLPARIRAAWSSRK